ncbi:uncharacterized protein [Scyliorhinus torazame]|uniref:uncharacterized protein isoform X2 n=1 Tax=Scyliorhinus torazame TaxID=75743 RepID=UPI003B5B3572
MLFTSTIRKNNLPVPGDLSGGRSFVTAETMQPPSLFGTERAADSIRGFKFENSEIIPELLQTAPSHSTLAAPHPPLAWTPRAGFSPGELDIRRGGITDRNSKRYVLI